MMANILFKQGTHAEFEVLKRKTENNFVPGALYFTNDEGGLYLGTSSTTYQRIQGVVQYYENLERFKKEVLPPYSEDVIYYIASENALVKWTGSAIGDEGNIQSGEFTILNVTASEFGELERTVDGHASRLLNLETLVGSGDSGSGSLVARVKSLEDWKPKAEADIAAAQGTANAALAAAGEAQAAADKAQAAADAAQDTADANSTAIKALQEAGYITGNEVAENYATKDEVEQQVDAVLGVSTDDSTKATVYGVQKLAKEILGTSEDTSAANTVYGAKAAAQAAQNTADSKVTMAQVEAKNYATKTEVQEAAGAVLGTSGDPSTADTVYGAKKAAAEALAKATQGVNDAAAAKAAAQAAQNTADSKVTMAQVEAKGYATDTNAKQYASDAETNAKQYAETLVAANDAMTFIGVLGGQAGQIAKLPTTANVGDTYKVGEPGYYIDEINLAKVGDLIINAAENDTDAPSWVHISSGYEDDYLQKLIVDGNAIYLNDGINPGPTNAQGSITVSGGSSGNLTISADITGSGNNAVISITPTMVWGSFD